MVALAETPAAIPRRVGGVSASATMRPPKNQLFKIQNRRTVSTTILQ